MSNLNSVLPHFASPRRNLSASSSLSERDHDHNSLVKRNMSGSSSNVSRTTSITSKDSMVSVKHYDSLVGELRCPGCAKPMYPPIKLCETGHSICSYCTSKLVDCPLCSAPLTETRSVTLEAIVSKAQFGCPNVNRGCMVRLPLELMKWHKVRCLYQVGDCFMGKVWGDCEWRGCEIDWMDHCMEFHDDRVFSEPLVEVLWQYTSNKLVHRPVKGYYIFKVFDEVFNLYHIYNKPSNKLLWTLICASKEAYVNKRFAYEIEIYSIDDQSRVMMQRSGCHAERDADVLDEGRCVSFHMGDIMRLMDKLKVLHYRVKIIQLALKDDDNRLALKLIDTKSIKFNSDLAIDYAMTSIAGCNKKMIPEDKIITRKPDPNAIPLPKQKPAQKEVSFKGSGKLEMSADEDEDPEFDAEIRNLIEKKMEEDMLRKRKALLRGQSGSITSFGSNRDMRRALQKEFTICEATSELQLSESARAQLSRRNSKNDIELDMYYTNQGSSQPPSLPMTPVPIQKVICKEKVVQLPKAGVCLERSYSVE